jgi:hypothetical protein
MTARTAEQAKQNYIEVMGVPLGSLFHSLWQEVVWLFYRWREFEELFGERSRVELLNQAAPAFFHIVQDTLWKKTLLDIACLTDYEESAGKENLTIRRLAPLISDDDAAQRTKTLTGKAIKASRFCRNWRNRLIAHRSLSVSLCPRANALAPATREKVTISLGAIADVLNAVTLHYMQTTTRFDPLDGRSAVALLHVIDDGLRTEHERRERLKRGEFNVNDLRSRDL